MLLYAIFSLLFEINIAKYVIPHYVRVGNVQSVNL